MTMNRKLVSSLFIFLFVTCCFIGRLGGEEPIDFPHEIVPIIRKHCIQCHSDDQKKGGFSFNTRESTLAGGESGAAILASKESICEILNRISSSDPDLRMPPEGPSLNSKEIDAMTRWIDAGLPWESGFSFGPRSYEPPLFPRKPELPAPSTASRTNPIDRILDAERSSKELTKLPRVDDAILARRLYMDLIGLLPTPEELQSYLDDQSSDKQEKLIRDLLARDIDYAEHWLTFWNDLLRNDYSGTGFITGGRTQISKWLYDALVTNKPYDLMARELIAPPTPESAGFSAGIRWRGEVSAGQTVEIQFAQNVGQAFLGINLKCASCHDSFVDRWKLKDSFGIAAIYATGPLAIHRCDKPTGEQAQAAWLFPELGNVDPSAPQPERLQQLASLMTHPQNGRFARTIVNRLWHRLMGRGIVHPTDAMQSQPWNEDLLDSLAAELVDHKYDLKKVLEVIASSEAYAAVSEPLQARATSESYTYNGPRARRMTAEQFVDAVWQLTNAAPQVIDAPVIRINPKSIQPSSIVPATGKWIWSESANAPSGPPANEKVTFRKKFELPFQAQLAYGVITCDNQYKLWINGKQVVEDGSWESLEDFDATTLLQKGSNEIIIQGINGGSAPNPAALYFELHIQGESTSVSMTVVSATDWEVTSIEPNAQGTLPIPNVGLKSATEAKGPWDSALHAEIQNRLTTGMIAGKRMVRASLIKADFLMRSLGRPHREQIVSMRPTELTTLEAIDLTNGQALSDWLKRGAERFHATAISEESSLKKQKEMLDSIYRLALSRSPNPSEFALLNELIGTKLEVADLEDILWSIVMLPEFQYVR